MTISESEARVGQPLRFVITVRNDGPSPASNVVVWNPVPANTEVVSAGSSQGTVSHSLMVVAELGELTSGGTATVTLVVRPLAPGLVVNTATVVAENDPNVGNNTASAQAMVVPLGDVRPPMVVDVGRHGYHGYPTQLVLRFSEPMDAARA